MSTNIKFYHAQKPSNFHKCVKYAALIGEMGARESVKITVEGFILEPIQQAVSKIERAWNVAKDYESTLAEYIGRTTEAEQERTKDKSELELLRKETDRLNRVLNDMTNGRFADVEHTLAMKCLELEMVREQNEKLFERNAELHLRLGNDPRP